MAAYAHRRQDVDDRGDRDAGRKHPEAVAATVRQFLAAGRLNYRRIRDLPGLVRGLPADRYECPDRQFLADRARAYEVACLNARSLSEEAAVIFADIRNGHIRQLHLFADLVFAMSAERATAAWCLARGRYLSDRCESDSDVDASDRVTALLGEES